MRRSLAILCLMASTGFTFPSIAVPGLGVPTTVLDCSPCTTVNGHISSTVGAAQAAINANTTTQMQSAATMIVGAITQSTAQVSSTLEKNTAAQKELMDALIAADYKRTDAELQAQLKYNHAIAPGGCKTPTFGYAMNGADSAVDTNKETFDKRNTFWNTQADREDWSPSMAANTLRDDVNNAVGDLPEQERPTMSVMLNSQNYTEEEIAVLDAYARTITNPKPIPQVVQEGEADDVEGWLRREHQQRKIELAQSVVAEVMARRAPAVELRDWYTSVTGKEAPDNLSWMLAWDTETERRVLDPQWSANMLLAPPTAVQREIATIDSLQLYVTWKLFKEMEKSNLLNAANIRKDAFDDK